MFLKKVLTTAIIIVVFMSFVVAHAGDDVTPLVEKGRKAYADGDYQAALEYFQQVVQMIQAGLSESFEGYFPEALSGWTADEIKSQSWTGTTEDGAHSMTNLTREYRREDGGVQCTIALTNWPQVVQGMRQSLTMYKQMGAMMNQDPDKEVSVEEKDGWTILIMVEIEDNSTQIMAVSDKLMLNIDLNSKESKIAREYLGKMDLKALSGL